MVEAYWSLTQSACNHIILYMAQLIGSCYLSSKWACCSTFKYLVSICPHWNRSSSDWKRTM